MLRFVSGRSLDPSSLTRRQWLGIGSLFGLTWASNVASAAQPPATSSGRAKSVILVYAGGGQSQFETWDPKPDAPAEIRGAFDAIQSPLPGVLLSEHLPQVARLADRYTIVRSMSHQDLDHGSAMYASLTGRYHPQQSSNPPPRPTDFPALGAVLHRVQPSERFAYSALQLNGPMINPTLLAPGQFGGFLGSEFDPPTVGDPTASGSPLPGLDPQPQLPPVRVARRQTLLQAIDGYRQGLEETRSLRKLDELYRQAFDMLATPRYRRAFDLSQEPEPLRDRYGRNRSGQSCLLARRLVEAGVPFVSVFWNHSNRGQDKYPGETDAYGWDTHNDIFASLRNHLLPRFDQSFSALLEDLDERGLLEDTLVICMGEFGRAPLVAFEANFKGKSPGRKHWGSVYSVVMAGAGVQRGAIVGESDRMGAHPVTQPYGPPDIAATVFWALGLDPKAHYRDRLDRPFPLSTGNVIREAMG